MKTKYILNGGFSSEKVDIDTSDFYKEICKDAPEDAKVLIVLFAKDDPERIRLAIPKITSAFEANKGQRNITIEIATEEDFISQVQSADIVYFTGGVSVKLFEALKKYPNLEEALLGKTIAGESAGAIVFCKYFYSPQANAVFEGLGYLHVKIIPHYVKEYEGKLDNVAPELEAVLLPEYEFRVFYK